MTEYVLVLAHDVFVVAKGLAVCQERNCSSFKNKIEALCQSTCLIKVTITLGVGQTEESSCLFTDVYTHAAMEDYSVKEIIKQHNITTSEIAHFLVF